MSDAYARRLLWRDLRAIWTLTLLVEAALYWLLYRNPATTDLFRLPASAALLAGIATSAHRVREGIASDREERRMRGR